MATVRLRLSLSLRNGRKVPRMLYEQRGARPAGDDPIVGLVDTPELAALIVGAVNRDTSALRTALAEHYLAGITCDGAQERDNPVCACSRIFLGWHPSVGDAVGAWIGHVLGVLAGDP